MSKQETNRPSRLRALPSVDALLRTEAATALREAVGSRQLTRLARAVTDELRESLLSAETSIEADGDEAPSRDDLLAEAARRLERAGRRETARGLRRVINATGVVLHTNLGRAPLSAAARRAVSTEAARYCTLEYDTQT